MTNSNETADPHVSGGVGVLSPCPFCGGKAETDRYGPEENDPEMAINCRGECDGIFVFPKVLASDYAGLRHAWNTRLSTATPVPATSQGDARFALGEQRRAGQQTHPINDIVERDR